MSARQRGRPRNPRVDTAATETGRDLLSTQGPERMTIEEIAAEQTVYRRRHSKAAPASRDDAEGVADVPLPAPAPAPLRRRARTPGGGPARADGRGGSP